MSSKQTDTPKSLKCWIEQGRTLADQLNRSRFSYYGYYYESRNKMFLAKMVIRNVTYKQYCQIRWGNNNSFFKFNFAFKLNDFKRTHIHYIQIGRNDVLFVEDANLYLLPVPFDIDEIKNRELFWIITNDMYTQAYNFAINALLYAKQDDWKSFQSKFIDKLKVKLFSFISSPFFHNQTQISNAYVTVPHCQYK